MPNSKTIHLVIFGIGNVGSTLINQINEAKEFLNKDQNLNVKISIVANSRYAFFGQKNISNTWECDFKTFSVPYKIEEIIQFANQNELENLIAIDATASEEFVQNYIPLIQNGFHIISANKIANTLHYDFYKVLRSILKKHSKSFLYETNVGAGLPVIETVNNLHKSGEKIEKIRGVFSGSLSYIFNTFSIEDIPFSKALDKASTLGLTEPDVREDLSGKDIARKLLILARELGLKLEFKDVSIDSLVPKQLNRTTSLKRFNEGVKDLDIAFHDIKAKQSRNHVLRYVGELDVISNKLDVKLVSERKQSALGQLKGADTLFEIYTESYGKQPLIIQGAGAGKEVTSRGVLSDIIKLSRNLN